MRILHVIDTMNPAAGGPTEVVRMLVQHAPDGYESEIVTLDPAGTAFLRDLGCPVHGLGGTRKSFYNAALLPWLNRNRERFDGVISHGLWRWPNVAVPMAFAGHKPYAVFPHGMLDPYFKRASPLKHLAKYPFWLLAEYWSLRNAHRTIFTTTAERNLAAQSFWPYACRPTVAALGTEPALSDTPQRRRAFFELCPAVRDRRFFLYLGRIHPKKGADLLIAAFNAVAAQQPDLDIVMAGPSTDGWAAQLRERLAPTLQHRVHWPGMLRDDAKHGALAACEAFILPSHQENFGIAVVEALAAARPVLVTHAVNIAADVVADGAGLAGPDSIEGITALLKSWLALSSSDREAMSAKALRCFQTRYDMRVNAPALLRLFEQP